MSQIVRLLVLLVQLRVQPLAVEWLAERIIVASNVMVQKLMELAALQLMLVARQALVSEARAMTDVIIFRAQKLMALAVFQIMLAVQQILVSEARAMMDVIIFWARKQMEYAVFLMALVPARP